MPSLGQTTLSGEVLRTTERAILFRSDDPDAELWVPRSVCIDGDTIEKGDTDLVIADWWLKKEGIIL